MTTTSIGSLEVVVLHTTIPATLCALRTAAGLADGLGARIRLLVPQLVPFALPLDSPPIARDFLERRFRTVASDVEVETHVDIRLCRDQWTVLQSALRPHSLVVLGGRGSWWPSAEKRLAQRLRRAGHQVVFCGQ
jgi:hypothetical protein